jgi:protoporphyrinogen IX oxidase
MSAFIAATRYEWLLFLHILAAMIWLGGLVTLAALSTLVVRSRDETVVARFVSSLRVLGPLTLAPAMVAVLAFGIGLVLDSDAWAFDRGWIVLALSLFAAVVLVGVAFQARAATRAQRAAAAGDHAEAVRWLRHWAWGMRLILVLLVVTTWDMVAKPGL